MHVSALPLLDGQCSEPVRCGVQHGLHLQGDLLPGFNVDVVRPDIVVAVPVVDGEAGRVATNRIELHFAFQCASGGKNFNILCFYRWSTIDNFKTQKCISIIVIIIMFSMWVLSKRKLVLVVTKLLYTRGFNSFSKG